jgi:hypothetical protein
MTRSASASPSGDGSNSQSNQGGPGDRDAFGKIEDDLQSEAQGRARAKPDADAVKREPAQRFSRTGAALGDPAAEHSQYGLTDSARSPEDEKKIRGVKGATGA